MAKKAKKPSTDQSSGTLCVDSHEVDHRPTSSPYTSTYVNVLFGGSSMVFKVPRIMLQKCSNLPPYNTIWNDDLRFPHVPEDVGHILIHHLFTGTWQCLAPKGSTNLERQTTEFITCIRAYVVAQEYKVNSLEEQARSEIERLGQTMSIPAVLSALVEANPFPSIGDVWLCDYLKARMETLFNNRAAMKDVLAIESGSKFSMTELLFKTVLRLRLEEAEVEYVLTRSDSDGLRVDPEYHDVPPTLDEPPIEVHPVVGEVLIKEVSIEELPIEELSIKKVPVGEVLVDEVPAEEVPVDEVTADEVPADEVPADEVPADEVPADEVPAEEVPVDEVLAEEVDLCSASDPDSTCFILTPPSSSTSCITTAIEPMVVEEPSPLLKKGKKGKKGKKALIREQHQMLVAKESSESDISCEFMKDHMKPGSWMVCQTCRKLVEGLAAELKV